MFHVKKNMTYTEIDRNKKRQQIAFRRFMTGEYPSVEIRQYVSINYSELRVRIEQMMIEGMSWDNYGKVWAIDHIVPLRLFDLFNENELKTAWNYQNLMPLFKADNLHKEGDLRFAKLILEGMEKTTVVSILLDKVHSGLSPMNKYLKNK